MFFFCIIFKIILSYLNFVIFTLLNFLLLPNVGATTQAHSCAFFTLLPCVPFTPTPKHRTVLAREN